MQFKTYEHSITESTFPFLDLEKIWNYKLPLGERV